MLCVPSVDKSIIWLSKSQFSLLSLGIAFQTDKNDRITVLQVQLESATASPSRGDLGGAPARFSSGPGSMLLLNSTEPRILTVELLCLIANPVQEFVAAMSDFHTYWEHRLRDTRLVNLDLAILRQLIRLELTIFGSIFVPGQSEINRLTKGYPTAQR